MKIPRVFFLILLMLFSVVLASCPCPFTVTKTPGPNSDKLIFKLVNQWGIGSGRYAWENVADGALWITADAMLAEEPIVMFFDNLVDYDPVLLATFRIEHPRRADLDIRFTIGNPDMSFVTVSKTFLPSNVYIGDRAYSNEIIALDLSEWVNELKSENLYISIYDYGTQTTLGRLSSFQLEVYQDYNKSPEKILTTSTAIPLTINKGYSANAVINTAGNLDVLLGKATTSGSSKGIQSLFSTRQINDDDYRKLREKLGVFEEGHDYNKIISNHGTGLAPPTEKEWTQIKTSGKTVNQGMRGKNTKAIPSFIDLSKDPYFPPIGDQGQFGSCAAFSTGYYMKTYMEAKKRGWDVSDPSFINTDYIMSPQFIFEVANDGQSTGISASTAIDVITQIGCTRWSTLPYTESYSGLILEEAVWREAPIYRGRKTGYSEYGCLYMMSVDSNEKIEIIKTLLAVGIPLHIGVDADQYSKLDLQDIWDIDNYHDSTVNHGNTIVGYKMPEDL